MRLMSQYAPPPPKSRTTIPTPRMIQRSREDACDFCVWDVVMVEDSVEGVVVVVFDCGVAIAGVA